MLNLKNNPKTNVPPSTKNALSGLISIDEKIEDEMRRL
jgi:hypothetical protein